MNTVNDIDKPKPMKYFRGEVLEYKGSKPELQGYWVVLALSIHDGVSYQLQRLGENTLSLDDLIVLQDLSEFELHDGKPDGYDAAMDPMYEIQSMYF